MVPEWVALLPSPSVVEVVLHAPVVPAAVELSVEVVPAPLRIAAIDSAMLAILLLLGELLEFLDLLNSGNLRIVVLVVSLRSLGQLLAESILKLLDSVGRLDAELSQLCLLSSSLNVGDFLSLAIVSASEAAKSLIQTHTWRWHRIGGNGH